MITVLVNNENVCGTSELWFYNINNMQDVITTVKRAVNYHMIKGCLKSYHLFPNADNNSCSVILYAEPKATDEEVDEMLADIYEGIETPEFTTMYINNEFSVAYNLTIYEDIHRKLERFGIEDTTNYIDSLNNIYSSYECGWLAFNEMLKIIIENC